MDFIANQDVAKVLARTNECMRRLIEAGLGFDDLQKPIDDREMRQRLVACWKNNGDRTCLMQQDHGYSLARSILGTDFISPEEIIDADCAVYTGEALNELWEAIPSRDELQRLSDNDFILLPNPPKMRPLQILDGLVDAVGRLWSRAVYAPYRHTYPPKDVFDTRECVTGGWLKLRKTPLTAKPRMTLAGELALLAPDEYVVSKEEVLWGIIIYKATRRQYLFPNVSVKTSTLDSNGFSSVIGPVSEKGVSCDRYCYLINTDYDVCTAIARK